MKRPNLPLLLTLAAILSFIPAKSFAGSELTGLLDTTRYDRWLSEKPTILVVKNLDQSTRELLERQIELAEAVLHPKEPETFSETIDAEAELKKLQAQYPDPFVHTEPNARYVYGRRVTDPEHYFTDHHKYVDSYWRRFRTIRPQTIRASIRNIKKFIERDLRDIGRNYLDEHSAGHQQKANRGFLLELQVYLQKYQELADRLAEESKNADFHVENLRVWQAFEKNELPLLQRALEKNSPTKHPVADDGTYRHPKEGTAIIHFKINNRDFYYLKESNGHQFRTLAETDRSRIPPD